MLSRMRTSKNERSGADEMGDLRFLLGNRRTFVFFDRHANIVADRKRSNREIGPHCGLWRRKCLSGNETSGPKFGRTSGNDRYPQGRDPRSGRGARSRGVCRGIERGPACGRGRAIRSRVECRKGVDRRWVPRRSRNNCIFTAPAVHDVKEAHFGGIVVEENPVHAKDEPCKWCGVAVIVLAHGRKASDEPTGRHEFGDEVVAFSHAKVLLDVHADIFDLLIKGGCEDYTPHASMEGSPLARLEMRPFKCSKYAGVIVIPLPSRSCWRALVIVARPMGLCAYASMAIVISSTGTIGTNSTSPGESAFMPSV